MAMKAQKSGKKNKKKTTTWPNKDASLRKQFIRITILLTEALKSRWDQYHHSKWFGHRPENAPRNGPLASSASESLWTCRTEPASFFRPMRHTHLLTNSGKCRCGPHHSPLHFFGLLIPNIFIFRAARVCDGRGPTWYDARFPLETGPFLTALPLWQEECKWIKCSRSRFLFISESGFTMRQHRTMIRYLLLPAGDCAQKLRYLIMSLFFRHDSNSRQRRVWNFPIVLRWKFEDVALLTARLRCFYV